MLATKARSQEDTVFSLSDALSYAENHAYDITQSNYELKIAQKKIWETTAIGLPQVSVDANYNNNLELMTQMLPAELGGGKKGTYIGVKFGQKYTADAAITATQLLFDGAYIVGLKASKIYYELAENRREKLFQLVKEGVLKAYFYVLASEINYETLKKNLETSKSIYEETKAYFEEGFREDTDVAQASLSVNRAESLCIEAKRSIVVARTTLKYLMGLDINRKIKLSSNFEELIEKVLLRDKTKVLDWEKHIDYRILHTQYEAQELMLKKEISSYLPRLSAFYRLGKNTSSNEWNVFDTNTEWYSSSIVGIKLTLPIFSSGMRHSRVGQQRIELQKVGVQMTQTLQNMEREHIIAKNNLSTAQTNYFNSEKSRTLAKKILDKTQLKYREGVSNSFELSRNEQQFLEAHSNFIGTIIKLLEADVAYKKAMGEL